MSKAFSCDIVIMAKRVYVWRCVPEQLYFKADKEINQMVKQFMITLKRENALIRQDSGNKIWTSLTRTTENQI